MEYPPYPFYVDGGGVGTYTKYLSKYLSQRGHEVHVITCGAGYINELIDGVNVHRVKSIPLRMIRVLVFSLKASIELRKLIKSSPFDIIHNQSPYGFFEAYLNIFRKNIPFISTIHAVPHRYLGALQVDSKLNIFDIMQKISSIIPKNFFNKIEYKVSKKIIAVSNFVRQDLLDFHNISQDKIKVIHNGVDENKFVTIDQDKARIALNLPRFSKIILFVGRLIKLKGCELLIKNASEIIARHPDVHIVIVGSGTFGKKLLEASQNLREHILFTSSVSHDILPLYYAAADVVVFPSLYEGAPFVLLESMASSKAIIATNIPPITEFVDANNAVLINPNNVSIFIEKLSFLLSNEQYRNKLGRHARCRILENFTWKITAKKTEEVYKEALNNK